MNEILYNKLNYKKAYRESRMKPALWVLEHPDQMKDLVGFCFGGDQDIATKAIWSLEFVCRENLSMLYPFIDHLVEFLPKAKDDGQKRTISYLCELLALAYYKKKDPKLMNTLNQIHKEKMVENCFDWMINAEKVACQVRAMTALYYLGTEIDWVHDELRPIIESNIHHSSAGYKSRGRHILELIGKHNP